MKCGGIVVVSRCAPAAAKSIGALLATVLIAQGAAPADSPAPGTPQTCSIRWQPNPVRPNQFIVEVSGLSALALQELHRADRSLAQWQRLLSVHAEQGSSTNDLAVGAYRLGHGSGAEAETPRRTAVPAVPSGVSPAKIETTEAVRERDSLRTGETPVLLPPMLGSYHVKGDTLCFEPQFPLAPGVTYRAMFDPRQVPGAGGKVITAVCPALPRVSISTTTVSHVYPTTGVLPENLLKFYLHFSAPMSRGHIYDYIHLRGETGKDVELPFLEIGEELWDPAMTRLTLFIDPGRIKRGVRPLEEVGPALEQGKRYQLVIDRAWQDGAGNPLKTRFVKSFRAAPPDRSPPDPAQWKIRAPKSGTRQPLTLTFPKPMDQALAQRVIHVTDESGQRMQGQAALQDEERRWTFVPEAPWPRGPHRLMVETTIEDLAGNNIGKPFEVDLFNDVPGSLTNATLKLPFEIR